MLKLRDVLASTLGVILALVLAGVVSGGLLLLLIVAFGISEEEEMVVRDRSVLVWDLSTPIRDTQPLGELTTVFSTETGNLTLRQAIASLEAAAEDDRIVALLIDGRQGEAGLGFAMLRELRPALEAFQASGKKIVAYGVDWGEGSYYLGSIADPVVINPLGSMEMNGLSAEQSFLTGALDRFGIGVQVLRVGEYKSAVEPFTETEFSPENREQLTALLGDLWGDFLTVVGGDRDKTPQQLQQIAANQGILLPEAALTAGLVDEIAYFDEIAVQLRELTEETEEPKRYFRQISLSNYYQNDVSLASSSYHSQNVAVLYAEGEIVYGEGEIEQIGSDRLIRQLRELRDDDSIKAIVLRVNSPGGSATASELILRELQLTREEKPIVISMGNVAASGGYWIAMGGDRIFAETNTITGSIGVFGLLLNLEGITNNNGITWDTVKTAPLADLDTISRPKTDAEIAKIQQFVDQIYTLFLEKVAKGRDLPPAQVAALAQGRVWSGADALSNGLVDEIGGLERAIAYAAERAKLGEDWGVEEYQNEPSFEELLMRTLSVQNPSPLTAQWLQLQTQLRQLQTWNDPRQVYALWPRLEIR
ncbi:signal peptide peptidase SppA [Spirulina sp. CCNP1310]|uniref:signal peptide peptidase SppA n=1 Tax=Spirulina sp. CCNP1310 TaxID=3110249 RepID=UPI002B219CE0|nr:signal peptide peptidase SppA [Spirulina sp. CCNP1310]MEA5418519.1 signal peptide peptidase SppA [Spirulina sp. CCNP1310]